MGSGDKQFGRLAGLLMDWRSRVILDARQLKRITETVRNASRPLSVRDISQSMLAMGNTAQAIGHGLGGALTEALGGSEGRLQGREIGDILNSLQGQTQQNKHIQALLKLLTPKLAQFDSKLSMISLSMTLYRLRTFVVGAEERKICKNFSSAGLLRVLPQMMRKVQGLLVAGSRYVYGPRA
jgi:hypothetical protein